MSPLQSSDLIEVFPHYPMPISCIGKTLPLTKGVLKKLLVFGNQNDPKRAKFSYAGKKTLRRTVCKRQKETM